MALSTWHHIRSSNTAVYTIVTWSSNTALSILQSWGKFKHGPIYGTVT